MTAPVAPRSSYTRGPGAGAVNIGEGTAYDYWQQPPPEPSVRLGYWTKKIAAGWRPNKRVRSMGYDDAAVFFGIYVWEYIEVLFPLLQSYEKLSNDKMDDNENKK